MDRVVGLKAVVQIGKLCSRERMWSSVMRGIMSLVNTVLDGAQQGISSLQEIANLRQKNNGLQMSLCQSRAETQALHIKLHFFLRDCNYVLAAVEASKSEVSNKHLGDAAKRLREMVTNIPGSPEQKNSARLMALSHFGLVPENK